MRRWLHDAVSAVWAAHQSADVALKDLFSAYRSIGGRDRRRIADRCFTILRHRASLRYALGQAGADSDSIDHVIALADARFAPSLLAPDAEVPGWLPAALAIDLAKAPAPVRLELPDWIVQDLVRHVGCNELARLAAALLQPASLDLRINLGRRPRAQVRQALHEDNFACLPEQDNGLWPPALLRLESGAAVQNSAAFNAGHFEIQDAGSQYLAWLAGPRRHQTVVDFCAGAGGKSLAMSDLMRNTGSIFAVDTSARRLARLGPRARRAGASNIRSMAVQSERDPRLGRLARRADLVLVDAPCSGMGTLRRNPDRKWRFKPTDVAAMNGAQRSILDAAIGLVKPGGRLVYVTCSLLTAENEDLALAFEAAHPELVRMALADRSDAPKLAPRPATLDGADGFFRIWPHIDHCDGYFAAAWRLADSTIVV